MGRVLVFFGAGASRSFGLPTMTEMVTKFEEYLEEQNLPERYFYKQIKEKLLEGYPSAQVDIESIFSVISGIASKNTAKEMSPFVYYYIKRFSSEQKFSEKEIQEASKLNEELEKFVKRECQFNGSDDELLKCYAESYEPFFNNLPGLSQNKNDQGLVMPLGWKAYTTNYDVIFENYWQELYPITDFFNEKGNSIPTFDKQKNLVDHQTFVKLHGSIDWEKLEDGNIIKTTSNTFTRKRKKGTAMLYPIQQKDLYLHPWITLFDQFKYGLDVCSKWYVIGYGFNDEFIFEIFKEALSSNRQLIIINPNAKKLKKKFPEELQKKIWILPIKFGGKYFKKDFEDFVHSKRTIQIEIQTESSSVGIDFPCQIENFNVNKNEGFNDGIETIAHGNNETRMQFYSNSDSSKK